MRIIPYGSLVATSLLLGVATHAQAVTYTEVVGTDIDFYYDSSFWSGATVNGNTITLDISDLNTSSAAHNNFSSSVNAMDNDAVIAVAKSGYTLNTLGVAAAVGGNFSLSSQGGSAAINSLNNVSSGSYSSGIYTTASYSGSMASSSYSGASLSGNFTPHYVTSTGFGDPSSNPFGTPTTTANTVAVDVNLDAATNQIGSAVGRNNSSLTTASYAFTASPVPEPQTYAMLAAGLGLLGVSVWCRKKI